MDIFKLKERTFMRIISDKSKAKNTEGESSEPKCEKRGRKEKLDTFQKDLIKRSVYKFFERNEMMTIKRLRKYLIEQENLNVSKYILMKLLHQMGFKYKKDPSNSREVICERSDLVRLRLAFLRTIKRKRDGYTIVYTDETWVNSAHTAPYQWHPSNPKGRSTVANK